MTGIMSLMPAVVGQTIAEIVTPLGLASNVVDALCSGTGQLGDMLNLAESSESGDLQQLTKALTTLPGISAKALNSAQTQALLWANSISQEKTD
jgi:EAL and modified HD-GYP domain-containing signal transduction protein